MNYLTVCSGTEAFGPAWHRLGFRCVGHAEIAKHPSAVLRYHYPTVRNYDDFTGIEAPDTARVDLLAGGTPCQDFSFAGLRAGLAGDKGNLTLQFLLLVKRLGPRWILWENVPGAFSSVSHDAPDSCAPEIDLESGDGPADGEEVVVEDEYDADENHALVSFLAGLSELGYGAAYRTFDAQYFGVPQRRRRLFVVAYLGDWRAAAAVLFESESLRGDSAPGRETGQDLAGTLTATTSGSGPASRIELAMAGYLQTVGTLAAGYSKNGAPDVDAGLYVCVTGERIHALTATGHDASEDGTGRGTPIVTGTLCASGKAAGSATQQDAENGLLVPMAFDWNKSASLSMAVTNDVAGTLRTTSGSQPAVFVPSEPLRYGPSQQDTMHFEDGVMNTLCVGANQNAGHLTKTFTQGAVRRLTPRECERLMGWPDDWTRWGTRPDGTVYEVADGPRYEMCGNGWAAPVAAWIGERVMLIERLMREGGVAAC